MLCHIQIGDHIDEATSEVSRKIRVAAVDAFLTDLSPPDPPTSRAASGRIYAKDTSEPAAFVLAKPNCFVLYPMTPSRPGRKASKFRSAHSKTAILSAASRGLRGPAVPHTSRPSQASDQDADSDSGDSVVAAGSKRLSVKTSAGKPDAHSGPGPSAALPKKHCLVLSIQNPEAPPMPADAVQQRKARARQYSLQQLQAWKDGDAIPMPLRDTGPLDTQYGLRIGVHLTKVCFLHSKRFEDEIKATVDILKVRYFARVCC